MNKNIAWTIAGSDSGGGAGIQADLQTFQDLDVHGCSVITAITAQNSKAVTDIHYLPVTQVHAQLQALEQDLAPKAIKLGMIGQIETIELLQRFLENFPGKTVLDPVLYAGSGQTLFHLSVNSYISALKKLFPTVDLLTPNKGEAEILLGRSLNSHQDIEMAAQELLSLGAKSVLIKGGHFLSGPLSQDFWTDGAQSFWLSSPRIAMSRCHGAGCVFSAAITACLASGYTIQDALVIGKMVVNRGIRLAHHIGQGAAILMHDGWPEQEIDIPCVSNQALLELNEDMPDCGSTALGLYPIVDRADWLHKLLPLGVTTIQLRIKDLSGRALENEIRQSIAISQQYQARLFINDFWEQAIRFGAYGVHLGQNDLDQADLAQIRQKNCRLGMSTHSYYEMARAVTCRPSYIAYGPIYHTTSKIMPFAPQGLAALSRWRRTLNRPLVAIGGINLDRLSEVWATGVSGVAMISAITQAPDPISLTKKLLNIMAERNQ